LFGRDDGAQLCGARRHAVADSMASGRAESSKIFSIFAFIAILRTALAAD